VNYDSLNYEYISKKVKGMFFGREKELKTLNSLYESNQFEFIVIYGRRRIGKTSLINEFCKGKDTVFFSALRSTATENLKAFSQAVFLYENRESDDELSTSATFNSFEDAFDRIGRICEKKRTVVVMDEYPYLAGSDESISSRLQHLIDHKWSKGRMFLILCGSSMSFMEEQVLGYESPIYGRRTAQMKIEAQDYRESAAFNEKLTSVQKAVIYGITGGIPHYINKLNVKTDIDKALIDNFFNTSSYLYEEPENLLKQELREPTVYNSVLTAIAGGASKLNEISTRTRLENSSCVKYLNVLMKLDLIKKETPYETKEGKKSIYKLKDNFFNFWYRFIPENKALIESGNFERTYRQRVKAFINEYMGRIFEDMCKDYLMRYYSCDDIIPVSVGEWWGTDPVEKKEVQIDIVAELVAPNEYIIGSCKFRNEKTGLDELDLLKRYSVIFGKGERYHFFIFSKSGFTKQLEAAAGEQGVKLITIEDMY